MENPKIYINNSQPLSIAAPRGGQWRGNRVSFAHSVRKMDLEPLTTRRDAMRQFVPLLLLGLIVIVLAGCADVGGARSSPGITTAKLQTVNLNNPVSPAIIDEPVTLAAAKNEWTSFQVQVNGLTAPDPNTAFTLRLQTLNHQASKATIASGNYSAYQILAMPVDVNRAGYVRQTGLLAATRLLPRALLPIPVNEGRINLASARDPNNPTDPKGRAGANPVMLWVDLHIPPETPAGSYLGRCEVLQSGVDAPVATLAVNLNVHDLVMPDERHLKLVGQIEWENFERLYPERFEAISPRLITRNRNDPRYAPAVKTFDELIKLAHEHRVEVIIPRLQPNVKWPGGRPPQVDWPEFDSVVSPWFTGEMFADKVPQGYWPLPASDGLFNYDPASQRAYWTQAATHFDQNDWLVRSPVVIDKPTPSRGNTAESIKLSDEASNILAAHSHVRVVVPLEDDQIQFAGQRTPDAIAPSESSRLITANPGVVFTPPVQNWPGGTLRPSRWMRTNLTGLIPYVGAGGDERDVRIWAWMSFLPLPPPQLGVQYGPVQFIRWIGALPSNSAPNQPADPNELIWFYPGSWFGIDQPVPTIQLKWLRRAQQDYEYLYLAKQRGDVVMALLMSRLMSKPVELQPDQLPDPTYSLMCGTADPKAWDQAMDLLAKLILLHAPGQVQDKDKDYQLNIATLIWSRQQERPVIMGRSTLWGWDNSGRENWLQLRLGVDVYNPSDYTPDENSLAWTGVSDGWQVRPQPISIPALPTYRVRRSTIDARIDPSRLRRADRKPVEITFTNGFDPRKASLLRMVLPVANSFRREGMLEMNGSLDDWSADDAIQDGPMVRMFSRPALQAQEIQAASAPTQLFTGWADENFYLAFKATGLSQSQVKTVRNFVTYQFRRAWGEDLCEVLVQPVYADNSTGPVLHVVCKPTGGHWIERKNDSKPETDWKAYEGTGLRYIATIDGADWRGEVAIPWKVINDPGKGMPVMLRFNFTQHRQDTGESASWAGPIDFGRDDAFTGALILREPQTPGVLRVP